MLTSPSREVWAETSQGEWARGQSTASPEMAHVEPQRDGFGQASWHEAGGRLPHTQHL